MTTRVQAVYENGVLRPLEPLNLAENERVSVTLGDPEALTGSSVPTPAEAELTEGEFDQLLDELASGPALVNLPADFSRVDVYMDHD